MTRLHDGEAIQDRSWNPDPVHGAMIAARLEAQQRALVDPREFDQDPVDVADRIVRVADRPGPVRRIRAGLGRSLMALGERVEGSADCADCPSANPA